MTERLFWLAAAICLLTGHPHLLRRREAYKVKSPTPKPVRDAATEASPHFGHRS